MPLLRILSLPVMRTAVGPLLTAALTTVTALTAQPAGAVVKRLYPLKAILAEADTVAVARVGTWPGRNRFRLRRMEVLKGVPSWKQATVRLAGNDNRAHRPSVRERLVSGRSLLLFSKTGRFTLGYIDRMWFRIAPPVPGSAAVWQFVHPEPYLRRTFHGSVGELRTIVKASLEGTAEPPPPDPNVLPGY